MKISVIIPTRNRYDYISLLLEDLVKQDISNFEIIVVDQSELKKSLLHCTHIFTDSTGPCISRNIGAKKSTGDILVFLDDDARIYPNFIREMTAPIISDRFDAVAGAICDLNGNYLLSGNSFLSKSGSNFIKVLTSNPNSNKSRTCLSFPGCCAAIKKSVFDIIGGFNEDFDPTGAGEDREMAIKLFVKGFSIWYNADAKLLHAVAPEGGSRDVGSRSLMLDVHSYKICEKHFSKELASSLKKTIVSNYRKNFFDAILKGKLIRTQYRLYKELKNLLK